MARLIDFSNCPVIPGQAYNGANGKKIAVEYLCLLYTSIILGDFGGVWFGDERDDEALDWLEGLPFTVAFVSGNHENYDALARYPVETWHGGRVQPIRPHVLLSLIHIFLSTLLR